MVMMMLKVYGKRKQRQADMMEKAQEEAKSKAKSMGRGR